MAGFYFNAILPYDLAGLPDPNVPTTYAKDRNTGITTGFVGTAQSWADRVNKAKVAIMRETAKKAMGIALGEQGLSATATTLSNTPTAAFPVPIPPSSLITLLFTVQGVAQAGPSVGYYQCLLIAAGLRDGTNVPTGVGGSPLAAATATGATTPSVAIASNGVDSARCILTGISGVPMNWACSARIINVLASP